MTPGEAIKEALEKLEWSETRLAEEANIDRAAMHKIADDLMGLGEERAQRIVEAAERHGVKISLAVLLQPSRSELERLLGQAEATSRKMDEARRRLERAIAPPEHQGTDQSNPG